MIYCTHVLGVCFSCSEWKDKMNESTGNDTTIQIPHNHPRILEQRLSRDDMYMQATPGMDRSINYLQKQNMAVKASWTNDVEAGQ